MRGRLAGALVVLALCALAQTASAEQVCANRSDGELLADQSRKSRLWNWGWGSAYALAGGVQLGIAAMTDNEDLRLDMLVGGGKSVIGFAALVIDPVRAPSVASPCSELVPERLEDAAKSQAAKRSWFPHTGNVLLNAGGGLIVGLVDDRWQEAAIQAAIGIVVGEIQIFTTPSRARDRFKSQNRVGLGIVPLRRGFAMGMQGHF